MNKIKSLFAIKLLIVSTFSLAEEQQRYASITHTSSNFINQGYCGYSFTLDNGGNHMVLDHAEFGALEITLRMKDGQGKVLGDTYWKWNLLAILVQRVRPLQDWKFLVKMLLSLKWLKPWKIRTGVRLNCRYRFFRLIIQS